MSVAHPSMTDYREQATRPHVCVYGPQGVGQGYQELIGIKHISSSVTRFSNNLFIYFIIETDAWVYGARFEK